MNTVKCNKCGKINNFDVDTGSLKGRVTFNCGSCQHPILSVDIDNRDGDWQKYKVKISNIFDFSEDDLVHY